MKFYKCNLCGQVITKVTDTNVNVVCCGQPMKEIVPKEDEEGLTEKHVPCYVCNEDGIIIRIGETAHPMTKEHYIEWILIETNKGYLQRKLKPGDQPIANFTLDEDEKIKNIYAYCNLHALWKLDPCKIKEEESKEDCCK